MPVNPNEFIKKFPQLSPDEIRNHADHFNNLDKNGDGNLDANEVYELYKEAHIPISQAKVPQLISEITGGTSDCVDFGGFLSIFVKEKESGVKSDIGESVRKHLTLVKVGGARGERSYAQEEVTGFVNFINSNLESDPDLAHIMPINPDDDSLFKKCHDGILLCKMINLAQAETIHEKVIVKKPANKELNVFQINENLTLAINSCKSIGIQTVNIGPNDIRDGNPILILGLTWQLVRLALLKNVALTAHPELFRLLKPGETLEDFLKLSPEQILLRWLNYHLQNAGSSRQATNFTKDLADSEILTIVMKQIAPECCGMKPMSESDLTQRAELMLQESEKIDCRKFVTPKEIVNGHPRLNLAFVANLFNTRPGLEALSEAEKASLDEALFAAGGDRMERQFCLWMNSCGVDPFIVNLLDGLQDGLILLQMFDKIEPGCVDWKKVAKDKMNRFKAVGNLNYAVEVGKGINLSLVNISGADIYDKNKKLVIALLWQMMRYDYLKIFKKLGGGAKIKDEQIVKWANEKTAGKNVKIDSFRDEKISTSRPILTLIDTIKPDVVDWSIISVSEDEELLSRNAKYVLSMVRKYGGTIYALPEDIVEHNPQMVMTVYASLMAME